MTWVESFGMLLGRILIASYFLISGVTKIASFESSLFVYQRQDVPYPVMFLYVSTLLLIIGAFFVMLGYRTRIGALLLMLALLPTTFYFHNFWSHQEDDLFFQAVFFFKDIAIIGGLLYVISRGAGLCSVDALRSHRKAEKEKIESKILNDK